jgi:hypothetical protein
VAGLLSDGATVGHVYREFIIGIQRVWVEVTVVNVTAE